ncbi:hypothetical protein, partial [Thermoflexus sp.]|uniref:hypothetical protein n=1 Tax=Thermoflexus sp. TaxID=1969742 RepID=UPI002ADD4BEE
MRFPSRLRWGLLVGGLGLLLACMPGAPLSSFSSIFCSTDYRLCLTLEGDPRVGQPFPILLSLLHGNTPDAPPVTLTLLGASLLGASSLEVLSLDTPRAYQIQRDVPVPLVDPAELSSETFTVMGTLITVDLGHAPAGKIRHPRFPSGQEETLGEIIRVGVRLKEAGEWQFRGILITPVKVQGVGGSVEIKTYTSQSALLGWSTEAQAYWADHSTAFRRAWNLKSQQCGGVRPCTLRFPYDPY